MKNLAKIFMAVVLLAGITSCVQDTTVDEGIFQPTTEVTISVEDANRTALGAKTDEGTYPVYWSTGDKISVNGVASKPLAEIEEGAVKGLFQIEGTIDSPYKVSYPATAEAGQVLFAAQQSYVAGTFSQGAAAMYGESETLAIQMQHAAGVLQFPIKAAEGAEVVLKKVVVTNPNGKLAGLYNAALVEGELTLTPDASAINTISYNCGDLALSTEPVKLHIAVPAGEYEELRVSLVSADNQIMNFKVTAVGEKRVKAGIVREFNKTTHITFSGNDASFQITDSESLMKFAEMCANGAFAYSSAKVMNNFTFDNDTYTWAPVTGFVDGLEFDGGDFTITGLPNALFDVANGNIHNLKLNSTASLADTKLYHGLLANQINGGSITDCEVSGSIEHTALQGDYCSVAGVIGRATGVVTLTNVVNKASVTVAFANVANVRPYVAGVCGIIRTAGDNVSFINCSNTGNIVTAATVSGETAPKAHGMGGLIGGHYSADKIYVKDCSNSGSITLNHSSSNGNHLGGLIGSVCSLIEITASEGQYNTNSGAITSNGSHTSECSIAGCFGYTSAANSSIKKVKNLAGGTVTVNSINTNSRFNIGGVAPYVNGAGISFEDCYNYATVTYAGESTKGYLVIGGVIARSNGAQTYTNLHNHSEIVISSESKPTEFYYGGVIGRIHSAATISNCSNNKDLTINAISAGPVYVGGVISYPSGAAILSNLTNNNQITFTGASTTFYYAGGVIGYLANASATAANIVNAGAVTYSGTAGSTLYAGGVVGATTGAIAPAEGGTIGAKNSGAININGAVTTTNYIGGVIGYASKNVTGIENDGIVTIANDAGVGGGDQYTCNAAGGVIGRLVGTSSAPIAATNVINKKKVIFKQSGTLKTIQYANHGGVVGQSSYATLDNCDNTADSVVFKNVYGTISGNSNDFRHGAIVGGAQNSTIKNCDNSAHIGLSAVNNSRHQNYGGIAGWPISTTIEECTNSGNITAASTFSPKRSYVGGIVGTDYSTTVKNCTFSGKINYDETRADTVFQCYIGGISGYEYNKSGAITGSTFSGQINIASDLIDNSAGNGFHIGGIVGNQRETGTSDLISGCFVTGSISAPSTQRANKTDVYVGGIVGRQLSPLAECEFTGNVSAPGNSLVGAISGNSYAETRIISNCKVDGNIEKKDLPFTDITEDNFFNYVYSSGAPTDWASQNPAYNGNYGVKTTGGDSTDDLG